MFHKKTKIFLDSANPAETAQAIEMLGGLDGQTTNPSLVVKNLNQSSKISEEEMLGFYKTNVQKISKLIPNGSVSIEVYADQRTSAKEIYEQAISMNEWIDNAHIKFPTIPAALEAAAKFIKQGGRANFTLVFNQKQALAIHNLVISVGATKGQVFISPFVGRLDDIGLKGVDLLANVQKMYQQLQSPVEILGASIRNLNHLQYCFDIGLDIVTLPLSIIKEWHQSQNITYSPQNLTPIGFENLDYTQKWQDIDISHELTTKGLLKFAQDWKSLLE